MKSTCKFLPSTHLVFLLLFSLFCLLSCNSPERKDASAGNNNELQKASMERGKYLVNVMGCHDCHSPKQFGPQGPYPDPDRLLSGHPSEVPIAKIDTAVLKNWVMFNHLNTAAAGPWGVSFAANLTPDETGIGNWSEEQFSNALRKGKFKGQENGRTLLPPMPWPMYAGLTDEDVQSIFVYLKTLKPVRNVVPGPIAPNEIGKKDLAAASNVLNK
jgi:hypothetical protein